MRAGQFNRRKPKNLVGGGDRPANEFNVDFKEQRHLPASQYSGKKAKQRKLMAEMMITASAMYSAGSQSAKLGNGTASQGRAGGAGRADSSAKGRTGTAGGRSRSGGSRAAISRSQAGRMMLAREHSLERKQRRDERRERRKRIYQKAVSLLFGVILLLNSYAATVESRETKPNVVPEALADAVELAEMTPAVDWSWNMDVDPPTAEADVEGIGILPATVTYHDAPAQCTTPGTRTYTARAEHEEQVYTDTRSVPLPPVGHSFGDAQMTTGSEGHTIIYATCERCHKTYEISFQAEME